MQHKTIDQFIVKYKEERKIVDQKIDEEVYPSEYKKILDHFKISTIICFVLLIPYISMMMIEENDITIYVMYLLSATFLISFLILLDSYYRGIKIRKSYDLDSKVKCIRISFTIELLKEFGINPKDKTVIRNLIISIQSYRNSKNILNKYQKFITFFTTVLFSYLFIDKFNPFIYVSQNSNSNIERDATIAILILIIFAYALLTRFIIPGVLKIKLGYNKLDELINDLEDISVF